MSKTSERLNGYQTQMSIYAEQHKMILASDVLDMIEQLQDDLKDDVDKVVAQLEELKKINSEAYFSLVHLADKARHIGAENAFEDAIDIVKAGGVNE